MIVLSFSLAVDFHVINCQIFLKKKNLKEPKQWDSHANSTGACGLLKER